MKFQKLDILGLFLLKMETSEDKRGYFYKLYESSIFKNAGISFSIDQINISKTLTKGAIRGMHMQTMPHSEAKLVQCVEGEIFDVALDLRKGSSTFGKWHAEILSEENKNAFFIPQGFAHGFQTLSNSCKILYAMSGQYFKEYETGFRYDDPAFEIDWPMKPTMIAEKDKHWNLFGK